MWLCQTIGQILKSDVATPSYYKQMYICRHMCVSQTIQTLDGTFIHKIYVQLPMLNLEKIIYVSNVHTIIFCSDKIQSSRQFFVPAELTSVWAQHTDHCQCCKLYMYIYVHCGVLNTLHLHVFTVFGLGFLSSVPLYTTNLASVLYTYFHIPLAAFKCGCQISLVVFNVAYRPLLPSTL